MIDDSGFDYSVVEDIKSVINDLATSQPRECCLAVCAYFLFFLEHADDELETRLSRMTDKEIRQLLKLNLSSIRNLITRTSDAVETLVVAAKYFDATELGTVHTYDQD